MVKRKDLRSRFGFHATPFTREIEVKDRFPLPDFDEAITALLRTLDARMSCALIAPAGTGKTSILRAVLVSLPEARYRTHYVKVTGLSKRDMCREIAFATSVPPAGTYPALVRKLQARFSESGCTDGVRSHGWGRTRSRTRCRCGRAPSLRCCSRWLG